MSQLLFMQSNQLDGIFPMKPDATDLELKPGKLIQINSYSHELITPTASVRPSTIHSGFRDAQTLHGPMIVYRQLDPSTKCLLEHHVQKKIVESLQILVGQILPKDKKTNVPQAMWVIRMSKVLLTRFAYGPTGDGQHLETIEMRYSSISWSYRWRKNETTLDAWVHVNWNGENNMPTPDALLKDDKFTPKDMGDYFDPAKY